MVHHALLVRAPHIKRASERVPAGATAGRCGAVLFGALLPSVVRTIKRERESMCMDYTFAFSRFNGRIGHRSVSNVRSMRKTLMASKKLN